MGKLIEADEPVMDDLCTQSWIENYGGGFANAGINAEGITIVHSFDIAPPRGTPRDQFFRLNDPQLLALHTVLTRALEARIEAKMKGRAHG